MRTIILTVLLTTLVFAQSRSTLTHYKVTFGIVGKVGEARGELSIDAQNRYRIAIVARATGMAGILSHGRIETLESTGTIKKGVFVPLIYTNIRDRSSRGDKDVVVYRFDHNAVKIVKEKSRYFKEQLRSHQESVSPFYVPDDILSIFFNHIRELKSAEPGERFRFRAIGSGHEDGFIDIQYPEGEKLEELNDTMEDDPEGGVNLIAIIHQKIFSSKSGELFLHLSKEGVATQAVLKDVAMFGDFSARLQKIKKE